MRKSKLINTISLPLFTEQRGDLVVAEVEKQIPFPIRRIFYILNVPEGGKRGFHAHKKNYLFLLCIKGSVLVKLEDRKEQAEYLLNSPSQGLLIKPGIWHSLEDFHKDTVVLVLASEPYNEEDYIRNYEEFKKYSQMAKTKK